MSASPYHAHCYRAHAVGATPVAHTGNGTAHVVFRVTPLTWDRRPDKHTISRLLLWQPLREEASAR